MGCQGCKSYPIIHVFCGFRARLLNPCSPILPDILVHAESGLHVVGEVVLIGEYDTQCGGIFDSLAGTLGLKRLFLSVSGNHPEN